MGEELTQRISELVNKLPPMPENLHELRGLDIEQQANRSRFVDIIRNDPSLCADLLHVANEFCDRQEHPLDTIEDALEHFGADTFKRLISVSFTQKTISSEFKQMKYIDEYFKHSREISQGSNILAKLCKLDEHTVDIFSVAGLVHDIGRLVIMLAQNKTGAHLLGTSWKQMTSIDHDERAVLGLNHCEIGQRICSKWNLSDTLQEAVLYHHTPMNGHFNLQAAIIFTAHFTTASDLTGDIIKKILPIELLNKMHLRAEDLFTARKMFFSGEK